MTQPAADDAVRGAAAPAEAGDSLDRYRQKRDFERTPEPAPSSGAAPRQDFSFVVQKHAARRLHYDFRLELNGVLKSWAVTKGPSLDPADKRLAVHVEDHPLEYGSFEGVIPKGQYGGGTVMIWDKGRWEPEGDPEKGYAKGKLSFRLFGQRLRGRWTLARMGGRAAREEGYKNWLLIKSADEWVRPGQGELLAEDGDARSVASERTMAEIADAADRVWTSEGEVSPSEARRRTGSAPDSERRPIWPVDLGSLGTAASELPEFVAPELATLVDKPPAGEDWVHEIKFDGYRMQGRIEDGRASMRTRTGLDWTERFRHIADAAARLLVRGAILDGEIVALQPSGIPSFALLQDNLKNGPTDRLIYYVFDLLFLEGRDLRGAGLGQRKSLLEALVGDAEGTIRYSDHQIGSGPPFFENACRMALEGVISKRMSAPYKSGRTHEWLKSKCVERQEFVIGGFTKPTTKVRGVGALLLGYYDDDGKLVYVGRVGTGFSEAISRALREQLDGMIMDQQPFASIPAAAKRDVIWVEPRLVCEVEYRSWTHDGRLRHASFQGLREDKPAQSVHLERADGVSDGAGKTGGDRRTAVLDSARLTHPDRVLYPQQGLTKRGLAEYYVEVADWMLPHVAGRPLSLVRCPSGQDKECFYQKHITKGLPDGLREVMIKESEGEEPYPVLDGVEGLLALVQMNVLEIHPWGSRADDVERPDRLIFDLDPDPSVGWPQVIEAGLEMRERLSALKLRSFVKTTGGKGLHVVVPIAPRQEWAEVKAFCEGVATAAARDSPDRYTTNMAKAARPGKIFLDYLRNGRGATAIAAYSPRARPGAPVATPLAWEELSPAIASDHFTVATLPRRLKALTRDPWAELGKLRQSIAGKSPARARGSKSS